MATTIISSSIPPFGRGPYSYGRYARRLTYDLAISISSKSQIGAGAHVMWSAIAVPPCEPWTLLAACGCPGIPAWPT